MRSKRSLSIQVNKVSKIIRLGDDNVTAISKAKPGNARGDVTGRHKSTRVMSRGRNNGTAIFERNPQIAQNVYQRDNVTSLEDLKSQVSRTSLQNLQAQALMQSMTPGKISKSNLLSSRNSHAQTQVNTLENAMNVERKHAETTTSEIGSIAESFKHRSKSYFNPLAGRDLIVNVPEKSKGELNRLPPYLKHLDLIANGIGDYQKGVPRYPHRMGHTSQEEKAHLLGNFTRDNLNALQRRLAEQDNEREQDLRFANSYIRRENEEATRVEKIM